MLTDVLFEFFLFETGQLCAEQQRRGSFRVTAPLTRKMLEKHLSGDTTYGIQLVQDQTGLCKAGCIELRAELSPTTLEPVEGGIEETWHEALKLRARAVKRNIHLWIEHAGGYGWRLWLFAAAPVRAALIRDVLKRIADDAGLPEDTRIFPSYTTALLTGWVKLPPSLDRVTGFWSGFVPQQFDAGQRLINGPSWTAGAPDIPLDQAALIAGFKHTSLAALEACIAVEPPAPVAEPPGPPPLAVVAAPVPQDAFPSLPVNDANPLLAALTAPPPPAAPTDPDADWRAEFETLAYLCRNLDILGDKEFSGTLFPSDFRGCTDISGEEEGRDDSVDHAALFSALNETAHRGLSVDDIVSVLDDLQGRARSAGSLAPAVERIAAERMVRALRSTDGLDEAGFVANVRHIQARSPRAHKPLAAATTELPAQTAPRRDSPRATTGPTPPRAVAAQTAPVKIEIEEEFVEPIIEAAPPKAVSLGEGTPVLQSDSTALVKFLEQVPLELAVTDRSRQARGLQPMDAVAPDLLRALFAAPETVPTPSADLNRALGGGFRRGNIYAVASPPSGGKSVFSTWIADYVAAQGTPTLVYAFGHTREHLYLAGLAREAGVPLGDIESRRWLDGDFSQSYDLSRKLAEAARTYQAKAEFLSIIEAGVNDTIDQLRHWAQELRLHYDLPAWKPALVIVDGLNDLLSGNADLDFVAPEAWRVRRIVSALKQVARDLNVAVLATAEIDEETYLRALTAGRFKRQVLSGPLATFSAADVLLLLQTGYVRAPISLRAGEGDGAVETERDVWMDQLQLLQEEYTERGDLWRILTRVRKDHPLTGGDAQSCYARVSVIKNRSGRLATCLFMHERAYQRFEPIHAQLPDQIEIETPGATLPGSET